MSSVGWVPKKVIICGAGLHGCALAYYLTKRGHKDVTVVEREGVACAASGKGGGFLARDWGSAVTDKLHRVSYELHEQLAKDLDVKTYRKIKVLSVTPGEGDTKQKRKDDVDCPSWLDGDFDSVEMMDRTGGAQVSPEELCTKLMEAAKAHGARLVRGTVQGIETQRGTDGVEMVSAVVVDGKPMPADGIAVTMGPWSTLATDWFHIPLPISGIKSTSVVFKTSEIVEPFALFCGEDDRFGTHLEVYPRSSGEVYLCGVGGSETISPERLRAGEFTPGNVHADPARVKAAATSFATMSKTLGKATPDQVQACMRPCPPDAMPIMGKIPHIRGAFISAGHNCWGILWAPVSGKAMSELIATGKAECVNLSAFDPGRFMATATGGRGRKHGSQQIGEQW